MAGGKHLLLTILVVSNIDVPAISCFTAIFSFGDSLADTGNRLFSTSGSDQCGRAPYGETYFHRPTGRFSNGRLIVDFIAESVGVPFLPPFLSDGTGQRDFRQGANFAVGGATALSNDFFRDKGLDVDWTDYSLGTQLQWFKEMLPSLGSSKSDCDDILSKSLFLVGEIGGNDYNHPLLQRRDIEDVRTYVPSIINAISSAVTVLIELGAKTLVVPGNFSIGCVSSYLTIYESRKSEDYDPETGCIKWLNELSENHNRQLKNELDELRRRHSDVTIIYADYYEAAQSIFRSPQNFGFNKQALSACCGGKGPYNYNSTTLCGQEGSIVCDDPSRYICWDGLHLTESTYKIVADGLIKGPYAIPAISSLCFGSQISRQPNIQSSRRMVVPRISTN